MKERISVIMGVYNCADTLVESLDSLFRQTYKNFKIIICDDGSSDNTYEIANLFSQHHHIILIRNDENMGLNYTLNRCLKYADTEYVARMDGDDIALPARFEKEVRFLDSHPVYTFVSSNMIHFDEEGDFMTSKMNEKPQSKHFIYGTPFCHAPCMVRIEAYHAVGGYSIDNKLLRVEDYHLWFKMYERGYLGYNIQEPLYKMRDDRDAYRRRKFTYRVNEAYVMHIGLRMLKLPFVYQIYCLRPILVGLLPKFLYSYLRKL